MAHQQVRSSQATRYPRPAPRSRPRSNPTWEKAIIGMLLAALGLSLSGCGIGDNLWDLFHTDGDAEAQTFADERQRVRTFLIETSSFSIETNNDDDPTPSVTVSDSVTEYTMNSDGIIRFSESSGSSDQRFDVDSGDRIIERPGASGTGTVTIIDSSSSVQ